MQKRERAVNLNSMEIERETGKKRRWVLLFGVCEVGCSVTFTELAGEERERDSLHLPKR